MFNKDKDKDGNVSDAVFVTPGLTSSSTGETYVILLFSERPITGNLITMLRVKRSIFLQSHFKFFCLTSCFPSVFTSPSVSNSWVSNASKVVPTFFMMSGARWTADENTVFLRL